MKTVFKCNMSIEYFYKVKIHKFSWVSTFLLTLVALIGLLQATTLPLSATAVAQLQQFENATAHSNVNVNNKSSTPILNLSTGNKTFYEIYQEIQNVNETKMGFPADVYSRPVLVVNKGDNVTIQFLNVEPDVTDKHIHLL
jgi:hypothetical protein